MSELVTPSAEPSYVVSLALNKAPFGSDNDEQFFFRGEQIEQRFNLLLHLVRASDKVALLFAEHGLGKSTLLMQLQQAMGDDVRLCRINGKSLLEPPALTLHCLRELDVDEQEIQSSTDYNALLKQRCQQLQSLNVKALVLIDDIDMLSESSISTIMDWLSWRENEQFTLQAVLTAQSSMSELKTVHGRVQRVDLPALTQNELNSYLSHRLEVAGYPQTTLPFKTKEVKQIFKESNGNPKLINQLAHQKLLGVKQPSVTVSFDLRALFKWLGIGLVALLLILLLLFQDKINKLLTATEQQLEINELAELIPEQEITTVIVEPEPEPEALPEFEPEPEPEIVTEQQSRLELEKLVAELPVIEEQTQVLEEAPQAVIEATQPVAKPTPYHQHQWVLQQDSNAYTFQLMGSWDEQKVVEFIDKHNLTGDVAIFESQRNGSIWYSVVYGVFENKEIALQASARWPAPLNSLPKWLRRFDSVQQQVQK